MAAKKVLFFIVFRISWDKSKKRWSILITFLCFLYLLGENNINKRDNETITIIEIQRPLEGDVS